MSIVDNPNESRLNKKPEAKPELSLDDLEITESEETKPNSNPPKEPDESLPEKYRGKSAADIAKMHQSLESKLGQQGNEVGELRRTLDQFIALRLQDGTQPRQEAQDDDDDEDFYADPKKSVNKLVSKNPEIQKLKQATERAERVALQSELRNKHPDYEQVLQDGQFQAWVGESKLRQRLLAEADRNYDIEAADEVFSEFKRLKAAQRQASSDTVEAEKTQRKQEVKKASTGSARGASGTQKSSAKIFRRVDIVELMKTNPKRYEALMPEIRKAYEEGRVR